MNNSEHLEFHLPVRPFSPIDAHNRAAAAKGSPLYVQLTTHADYNGHHVTLSWNSYRQYYVAEYYWAGRVVLCRGTFADCLDAILREYARGALGSSASICIPVEDASAVEIARNESALKEGSIWSADRKLIVGDWWTWRHQVGAESARDMANPRTPVLIFDWELCQAAEDREEYENAVKAKYGRVYH